MGLLMLTQSSFCVLPVSKTLHTTKRLKSYASTNLHRRAFRREKSSAIWDEDFDGFNGPFNAGIIYQSIPTKKYNVKNMKGILSDLRGKIQMVKGNANRENFMWIVNHLYSDDYTSVWGAVLYDQYTQHGSTQEFASASLGMLLNFVNELYGFCDDFKRLIKNVTPQSFAQCDEIERLYEKIAHPDLTNIYPD